MAKYVVTKLITMKRKRELCIRKLPIQERGQGIVSGAYCIIVVLHSLVMQFPENFFKFFF